MKTENLIMTNKAKNQTKLSRRSYPNALFLSINKISQKANKKITAYDQKCEYRLFYLLIVC